MNGEMIFSHICKNNNYMKILKYINFLNEMKNSNRIPTYEECVEICSQDNSPFYESKLVIHGYPVSIFNYRLAKYSDFINPLPSNPDISGLELRGLSFVFNTNGSLYKRYILLEKFFNLNQVPESMYSVVKNYKIKSIGNKEDGSIASFIMLPNGEVVGKSKMGFDNSQANGINSVYKTNANIKKFVDWSLNNDITAIFEYVSPANRIVLRYDKEELILLRLRDSNGNHLDIKDYLDKIGDIKIAPFVDEKSLDELIKMSETETGKEGWVITFDNGRMIKIKTSEYQSLHGVLTNDLYRENMIIKYITEDRIDDVLGQVPEEDVQTHKRINRIISIIRDYLYEKAEKVDELYKVFMSSDSVRDFAIKYKNNPEFPFVMNLDKARRLKELSKEEIIKNYGTMENFDAALLKLDKYEQIKRYIENCTKRLEAAREWLRKQDPTIKFRDYGGDVDEN